MDKQLITFRSCCSFRQYMNNQPEKYGPKLFLFCDYPLNALSLNFIGRQANQKNVQCMSDVVKFSSTLLHFSFVNLTTNICFNNSQLTAELLQKQFTFTVNLQQETQKVLGQTTLALVTSIEYWEV